MTDDTPLTPDEESALASDLGCSVSDAQAAMAAIQGTNAALARIRVTAKRRARALALAIAQASY